MKAPLGEEEQNYNDLGQGTYYITPKVQESVWKLRNDIVFGSKSSNAWIMLRMECTDKLLRLCRQVTEPCVDTYVRR